ncbi:hypothetical protein AJ79_07333 [Helicocarpus griseus UAMH5409]|uniref:Protein kinase domain-containing protein n=1 Tax=Helicocarpus griseus UAMH5409 TaxID=1447875 RepID=A0A2B7WW50_9EURO|nr:hypothetical protein AJ79_07333 [Helicocarpus griseus UAMH5409]
MQNLMSEHLDESNKPRDQPMILRQSNVQMRCSRGMNLSRSSLAGRKSMARIHASDIVFPSQAAETGILSVRLGYAKLLSIPEPYEGSGYQGPEAEGCSMIGRKSAVLFSGLKNGRDFCFEVSRFSELTVHLFARYSDASAGYQAVPLGFVRVNPFGGSWAGGDQWVSRSGDRRGQWFVHSEMGSGDFVYVEKDDTGRSYGMKTIPTVDADTGSEMLESLEHPFIAPLKFAFKSPEGMSLLSPLASDGQLFYHLQRAQHFDVNKAAFYAGELLSVLDYLHGKQIILTHLSTENIYLDSFGHLSLCNLVFLDWGGRTATVSCLVFRSIQPQNSF